MQSVLNSMKGTALSVAEYLTPVLKVKRLSLWSKTQSKRLPQHSSIGTNVNIFIIRETRGVIGRQ